MNKTRTAYAVITMLLLLGIMLTAATFNPPIEPGLMVVNGLASAWIVFTIGAVIQAALNAGRGELNLVSILFLSITIIVAVFKPEDWNNYFLLRNPLTLILALMITGIQALDTVRVLRK